jgi:hypothetical protein
MHEKRKIMEKSRRPTFVFSLLLSLTATYQTKQRKKYETLTLPFLKILQPVVTDEWTVRVLHYLPII